MNKKNAETSHHIKHISFKVWKVFILLQIPVNLLTVKLIQD